MEDHNDEEVRVPEAEEDLFQMRREDLEDLLAQAREAGIASVQQPPPVSTGLGTSVKPTFKKTGLARQYEFNGGLIDILVPIADASQEGDVRGTLHQALTLLQQRNELLVIADSDPEVFEFYDQHSKAESLRSTNPILAAFLREKKKKEVKKPTAPRSVVWRSRFSAGRRAAPGTCASAVDGSAILPMNAALQERGEDRRRQWKAVISAIAEKEKLGTALLYRWPLSKDERSEIKGFRSLLEGRGSRMALR
ncbi:unnamed protein product [Haemonchus placei]|uniref:Uncharacterized protein n=1 Tax=Haemonchus placei TaxID=6290 RepID=A0A0N4W0S4_HAEPC|nr:unnamed protein product [Haemonchus placei]